MVFGDLGACAWERERDMIAWARRAIDDVHYFASKAARELKVDRYDPEFVAAWVAEQDADLAGGELSKREAKLWPKIRQHVLDAAHDGEHEVCRLLQRSGWVTDCEFPDFDAWDPLFLWQRECVRWALARLGAEGPTP
jgi:hypothetical protein